ncbi:ABC transporter permease [Cohnella silvisoli]|uniref:Iron ABC transporter permease n=1 Tax=Cohnella silvisoli TaxID=2873699 RepID=A0ABV1KQQ2_9BACL|nr:iron ABC transporter permease [Cohnella silvisoli]MCD9022041.1 iron ABC transporter permease [Cohnella silvisoli]
MQEYEYAKTQPHKRFTRLKNRITGILTNPFHVISIIALIFLVYTIVLPMQDIIKNTFIWQDSDVRLSSEADPGSFTLFHWIKVLSGNISHAILYSPLFHSLSIAFTATFISLILGGGLAWLVTRTDIPYKKTISFFCVVPYMLPSWTKAFAWLIVFKNDRIGGSQGLLQNLFHLNPPNWLSYGFLPITLNLSAHYFVFFFLLIAVALRSINSSLEESANILGANRVSILRKITFPLILPAILSGMILTFSKVLGTFGVPAFLGLPVKYYTISTMLYGSMRNRMVTEAYILCLILILISSIMIFINQRAIGKRKSYETIGGKDSRKTLTPLGKWRIPTFSGVILFLGSAAIFPLILLLLQSFMLKDGDYSLSNLTAHFWTGESNLSIAAGEVGVLRNAAIWSGAFNSFKVALIASAIASVMGLIMGYVISKGRKTLSAKITEQLSFLPYLIPSVALSAIYLSMFAKPQFLLPSLYGTLGLIMLITIVKELPFATRSGTSTMFQIGGELEEAAKLAGASWFRRFSRIMVPLCKQGLFSAFLLLFISAMKELDLIILLVTPKTATLTTLTFRYADQGFHQFSEAIIIIIIVIILITYFLASKIGKADISKGIGG